MPRAFSNSGKNLPRSLVNLKNALRGAMVGDSEKAISGAAAIELTDVTFESLVETGGTAGVEVVQLGEGSHIGQRKKVTFGNQANAADSISVTGGDNAALQVAAAGNNVQVVEVVIPATQYAAATSVFAVSPIAGNISHVRSVVDVITAGAADITIELATVEVASSNVVVADAAAVGVLDASGAISAGATTAVLKGQAIEVVNDGVPTLGEVTVFIEITPNGNLSPVQVPKDLPATQYDAGTSVYAVAPVAGRIRRVRTVATVLTAAVGTVTLELGGTLVQGSSVTIADAAAVGDLDDSGEIRDIDLTNVVEAGDPIEIVSDGVPTAGALEVTIEIDPNMGRAPVVIDKIIPAVQYAAATSVFAISPITGFISRVRSVVDVLTAGVADITLELSTTEVVGSNVAIADGAVIGEVDDSGAIGEVATAAITAGDAIEIVNDGVPTAGEVKVSIEINPTANIAAVALADPGEYALFECQGKGLWELVRTSGIVS